MKNHLSSFDQHNTILFLLQHLALGNVIDWIFDQKMTTVLLADSGRKLQELLHKIVFSSCFHFLSNVRRKETECVWLSTRGTAQWGSLCIGDMKIMQLQTFKWLGSIRDDGKCDTEIWGCIRIDAIQGLDKVLQDRKILLEAK